MEGFDFPDICNQMLDQCATHQHVDRLIIYTDGSSQSKCKRKPPLWIADNDISDSWSFAVFAENYLSNQLMQLMFMGIHCQQVLYDATAPHYSGTEHLGSDASERGGLFWAAIWRLAQNHRLPTSFLTDSQLTKGQALGETGATMITQPLRLLRGAFQALQTVLQGDALRVDHVKGHAGDPHNELVDYFAKLEGQSSLYLRRQDIDLRK